MKPRSSRLRLSLGAALALLALPLAAAADDPMIFQLTAKNGRFYPATIEVPAGKRFRLVVRNEGPGPEEFESVELRKETVLAPGVTRAILFAPMRPGTHKFFGEFHPDTAKGQIIVK